MTRQLEKTNPRLTNLILLLKNTSRENEAKIWREIAGRLETPTGITPRLTCPKINRYAHNGEIILVPGKVPGGGVLEQCVKVAALNFSESATSRDQGRERAVHDDSAAVKGQPQGKRCPDPEVNKTWLL